MTVAQLLAAIKEHYPSATPDATLVRFMNGAQDELSAYFGITVEDSSLTTTANDDSYAFPTGLEDVSQIEALDIGQKATPETRHSYAKYVQGNRDEIPVGGRCYFQIISNTGAKSLGIYPIPETTGLPIRIRFTKKLTDLSATSQNASPDFDSRFHDLLVWYACAMVCGSGASSDTIKHDYFMRRFEDGVNEIWKHKMNEQRKQKNKRKMNPWWGY